MAFTRESFGESLFASVGRSYRDLPATLEALACALVSHGRLHSLTMRIDEIGVLSVARDCRGISSQWHAPSTPPAVAPDRTGMSSTVDKASNRELVHEIPYAGRRLGSLQAHPVAPHVAISLPSDLLAQFARQCGRLVMRDRLETWSLERLGQPLRLIWLSAAMREFDRFVEAASASPLPVLLQGEYGTEKLATAAAIHCCGLQAEKPFVAVDCSDPEGTPGKWLDRAKGGKLYLSAIDGLSPPLQQALPRHFPSRLALWPPTGMQRRPRIIASTTRDLPQLVPNRVIQFHGIGMAYMQQDGATCLFPVGPNEEAIVRLDPTGAITLAHFEGGATGFLNGSDLSDRPGESKAATGRAPTRTRAASREPAKDSPQERTEGRQMSARAHDNPKPQARHSKVIEQAMEAASAAMKDAGKAYAAAGLDRSARFSPAERPCTRWASSPKPR